MEVGPTTHYIMGGVRVDADSQMSTIPGLFAAGECASGINGANRLGGNSLSDLIVFGKRAGEYAAQFVRAERRRRAWTTAPSIARIDDVAGAVRARRRGREPVQAPAGPAGDDAGLVGIVRARERDAGGARRASTGSRSALPRVGVTGHREYHSGWHTAHRSAQPAGRVGGDRAVGDRAQGKPRRPFPRGLSRTSLPSSARSTSW